MQIAELDTGAVGWRDLSAFRCGFSYKEVPYPLGRCPIGTCERKGLLLNFPLPVHTAKGAIRGKIAWIDTDKQSRVGIIALPGAIAHTVCNDAALFTGCRHHVAAGAHTEAVNRSVL